MATRWKYGPFDADEIRALASSAGVSPLVAQLLINRGVRDADAARTFLDGKLTGLHDPATLPGVVDAADRLTRAVLDGRKIVVYGDYDVDGVCGTSLLWSCLRLAGAKDAEYYIPHRVEEGYGVNPEAIELLARERGAEVVVTVDCGITAVEPARLARELGIELIVTDHHTIGPALPDAACLVHPRLAGSTYPFGELCGCGVAFKLAWELCKRFGDGKKASPHMREFLMRSMTWVALATIADVVPLEGENRLLVKHGLARMAADPSLGLKALLKVAAIDVAKGINAGQVGFKIGPRINAAGRLERAMHAVELLITDDLVRADELASNLDECNSRRQALEQTTVLEAQAMVAASGGSTERGAIVVGREGWHPGVVGIVASRLVEFYHRPAVVVAFTNGRAQGSARTVSGFNLYDAIAACAEGLDSFGGHAAAAGLKMKTAMFEAFAARFDQHCLATLTPEQRERVLHIDAETTLAALSLHALQDVARMEPHGVGNPAPVVSVSDVLVAGEPRFVGANQKTVQVKLGQGDCTVKGVSFSQSERWKKVPAGARISVAGKPQINEYNGFRSVQIEIKDFKVEGDPI